MESSEPRGHPSMDSNTRTALGGNVSVGLSHELLDVNTTMAKVKSPEAGAVVMFAGTTRNSFNSRPVLDLEYSAYAPLALQSMLDIASSTHETHSLVAICIVHRLGRVPIGEESILICVSAPHRTAAWRAGEEALERVKERVEIWKLERFAEREGGNGEAVWRANRDGKAGEWVKEQEQTADLPKSQAGET